MTTYTTELIEGNISTLGEIGVLKRQTEIIGDSYPDDALAFLAELAAMEKRLTAEILNK